MTTLRPNIVEFTTDPQLLGLSISIAQETLLRGIYGLPLPTQDHRDVWHLCTGGRPYRDGHQYPEVTVIAGARSGKDSRIEAPALGWEGVFGRHEQRLGRGERGVIPLVSQDARANAVARGYLFSYLQDAPLLRALVSEVKQNELQLSTRIGYACFPNTAPSLRAWSMPAGGMNEVGVWSLDGAADSDVEIQAAIRRGMVGFDRTLLLKCSTPYMRGGLLHDDFERGFGHDDPDLLVWRAPSALMNPTLSGDRLSREQRMDPLRYRREYEAEWVDDISTYVLPSWIDAAVVRGRHELPARPGVRYRATTDPTGGGEDEWALLIFHVDENGCLVEDARRAEGRRGASAPDLEGLVRDYAELLRRYRCDRVCGDRYAGSWPRQAFARHGITYEDAPCDRSTAYGELQPLLAQGRVSVLDDAVLVRQLKTLERRARPGGRDIIDHPRGRHDDRANVLALAAALVLREESARCACGDADCDGQPPWTLADDPAYVRWLQIHGVTDDEDEADDAASPAVGHGALTSAERNALTPLLGDLADAVGDDEQLEQAGAALDRFVEGISDPASRRRVEAAVERCVATIERLTEPRS